MLTRSGALWSRLEGLRLAVFEFVDGERLSDRELSAAGTVDQVAELVAAIHAATPALAMPVPAETFGVWADGLSRRLAELEVAVAGSGVRAEVRALVWPQRAALLSVLERLQVLGKAARSRAGGQVLCHGDLIGDNLLCDRAGRLWAVDWDGATRAPRELDLALFAGRGFQRFLDSYRVAAGDKELVVDPDLIGFFLLRRNLDDLVDWLGGALDAERPQAQRRGPGGSAVVPVTLGCAPGADQRGPIGDGLRAATPATLTGVADGQGSCDDLLRAAVSRCWSRTR
jgi:hypothetical protein